MPHAPFARLRHPARSSPSTSSRSCRAGHATTTDPATRSAHRRAARPPAAALPNGSSRAGVPEPTGELVRILREIAEQIEVGCDYRKSVPVLDINGNAVGSFMLVDELAQREQDLDGLQAKIPSPLGS
jgi:hypothetical protein